MEESKKELCDLIDKFANAKDKRECHTLLKAVERIVWLIYTKRLKEIIK